jgi:mono/diheme cytochrome c family protein
VVKQDDRWVGYSYIWNDQQTDADLVEAKGRDVTYTVKSAAGASRKQEWHYPSRNECMFCHSRAAGFVLGLGTAQMNRDNQLPAMSDAGYFKTPLKKEAKEYTSFVDPFDAKAEIGVRAKTYLHVNCSICHVSDGGGNSLIELGFRTPLSRSHMINEPPIHESFGIADARLVAPGDPQRSVLYHRMNTRGEGKMPPTSSNRVDEAGARLLSEWIAGMSK